VFGEKPQDTASGPGKEKWGFPRQASKIPKAAQWEAETCLAKALASMKKRNLCGENGRPQRNVGEKTGKETDEKKCA